ncbi:MAG: tetrahydromethanopterin S-methyltransferase subunit A [Nitrospirae bacterium]|nr:tetrahydromethanopterin S-methyltransferase subunit A [Nitrospirota bacterium]
MTFLPDWPPVRGEYATGDPNRQVAIITLASELDKNRLVKKAAIVGTMKTENIGIEKVVANIISNTSIRYLVVCGAEVHGHLSGDAMMALSKNGIDKEGRIIGAKGAIPYISNIPQDQINVWREQVEIIDLMNVEDIDRIEKTIDSLAIKEPCKWEPVLATMGAAKEEKEEGETAVSPELVAIEARVRSIEGEIKDLGKVQKVMAGMTSGIFQGFVAGFVITIVIFAARRLL